MKNKLNKSWKTELVLRFSHDPSLIGRAVAKELGIPWSSCWDMKQRMRNGEVTYNEAITKPKIFLYDIETSYIQGAVWSLWNQNLGLNQIEMDWYMLSWAGKWLDSPEVYSDCLFDYEEFEKDPENDINILITLWNMLDEADIVIGHNVKKFDNKKFNARLLANGLTPPSTYRTIDTLDMAKRPFALTSNKLDFIATVLKLDNKLQTGGMSLWTRCMKGDPKAWATMVKYNRRDVTLLEEVYLELRPWYQAHPNIAVYYNDHKIRCNACGSDDIEETGNFVYSNLAKYTECKCGNCGKLQRDGVNLLSKDKRKASMRNIIG